MPRIRREDTDMDQYLHSRLDEVGVPRNQTRRNAATRRTTPRRGDLWISAVPHTDPRFDEKIVGLIECKDQGCNLGDRDWQLAVTDGQLKALDQGLGAFIVTNTRNTTRAYNAQTLETLSVDGRLVTDLVSIPVLEAMQAQASAINSEIRVNTFAAVTPNISRFRAALANLRTIYRSRGMSKGSEEQIIATTLTFCILKLISEKQAVTPTLPSTIDLWGHWRVNHMDRDIRNAIHDITALSTHSHLHGSLSIDDRVNAEAAAKIVEEITPFSLFGSDFDFFGLIYETFASKTIKKDFGEYYTPRHIVRFVVKHLFSQESNARPITICDPACGTGGFLVEAFLFLKGRYQASGTLTAAADRRLRESTFVGLDTNAQHAIPYARTNMMMAGDGGANIRATDDSLLESIKNQYDYVIANVPYGQYAGTADISLFSYTNSKRFEQLFLEWIVEALKDGGKAAVIVPDGILQNSSAKDFRRKLLFDVRLDAIVSLPSFAFLPYTQEKTYILFFEKKRRSVRGSIQVEPIWSYIADSDGYQSGHKRFPVAQDDLTRLGDSFGSLEEVGTAGFVPMTSITEREFLRLDPEFHLRRASVSELDEAEFERRINFGEQLIGGFGNVR